MDDRLDEQPDRRFPFLQEMIEENAAIAGDVLEIGVHTFAIHGVIPVDGDVIMAEFDTYDEARTVLETLPANRQDHRPPHL